MLYILHFVCPSLNMYCTTSHRYYFVIAVIRQEGYIPYIFCFPLQTTTTERPRGASQPTITAQTTHSPAAHTASLPPAAISNKPPKMDLLGELEGDPFGKYAIFSLARLPLTKRRVGPISHHRLLLYIHANHMSI